MNIEILIVTHRYERLKESLAKIAELNNKILVVVDGLNQGIIELLNSLKNSNIRHIVLEKSAGKSMARNIGIKNSQADIIYFLDDDVYFEKDNIAALKNKFEKYPQASVIGGPNLTPKNSSSFQRASGYIFTSIFTAWKMKNRYINKDAKDIYCDDKSLILCNLAVKKEIFEKENIYFDQSLNYNEENLFLEQLKGKGYKMLYSPDIFVYHTRRPEIAGFSRQIFGSGKGRAIMTKILPKTLSWFNVIPSLFLIYLVLLSICPHCLIYPLFAYFAINVFNALYITIRNKENIAVFLYVVILSFVAHVSYGYGFLYGLIWEKKS
jgi:GT2 family glycosyltransferase